MTTHPRKLGIAAMALALVTGATACSGSSASEDSSDQLRYMVPNAPGSGWDLTARTAAKAMEDADVVSQIEVFNVDGANGTVGLARLASEEGNGNMVMQMGLGLVAATVTQESKATFDDTTPIAKLIDDYEVIVVKADSPYETIDDLTAAWTDDPGLTIGGGSAIGGADHITPLLVAGELGIDNTEVNYVTFGGGGILPAILGGQVDFAVTSIGDAVEQVKAGELRALAVSGPERYEALPDVPTLTESGIDVVFANWRGVVAPPELSDAEADALIAHFDDLHQSTEWADAVETNGWSDQYMTGEDFATYIKEQEEQVATALEGVEVTE
jgi:putative tricarboxylic transport membrane protein